MWLASVVDMHAHIHTNMYTDFVDNGQGTPSFKMYMEQLKITKQEPGDYIYTASV